MNYFKIMLGSILSVLLLLFFYSCINLVSGKISIQITKGAGNNYYEIEVYSNSNLSIDNTNSFQFLISDTNNVLLETTTGKLENGFSSWTSYRTYTKGAYIVVVKIDNTGDNKISSGGDTYSYKLVVVGEDSDATVNFSDLDNWYGL